MSFESHLFWPFSILQQSHELYGFSSLFFTKTYEKFSIWQRNNYRKPSKYTVLASDPWWIIWIISFWLFDLNFGYRSISQNLKLAKLGSKFLIKELKKLWSFIHYAHKSFTRMPWFITYFCHDAYLFEECTVYFVIWTFYFSFLKLKKFKKQTHFFLSKPFSCWYCCGEGFLCFFHFFLLLFSFHDKRGTISHIGRTRLFFNIFYIVNTLM